MFQVREMSTIKSGSGTDNDQQEEVEEEEEKDDGKDNSSNSANTSLGAVAYSKWSARLDCNHPRRNSGLAYCHACSFLSYFRLSYSTC